MLKFADARFMIFDNVADLENQSRSDGSAP